MLVIDNYDSFVYNLVQYLGELGAEPVVHRHDAVSLDEMRALEPDAVLISPGPGRPVRRRALERRDPGASASRAPRCSACASGCSASASSTAARSCARRTSCTARRRRSRHTGAGVFAGLPDPFTATRYHSLVVARDTVPEVLEITAESEDGLVMGLRHREFPIEGVQFHPESILTERRAPAPGELPRRGGRGRCARPRVTSARPSSSNDASTSPSSSAVATGPTRSCAITIPRR